MKNDTINATTDITATTDIDITDTINAVCAECPFYYCGTCHNTCTSQWGNPCPMA